MTTTMSNLTSNLTYKWKLWDGDPSSDRDKYIGGSDAGTILGLNPWKSPYTLWCEKTGLLTPEDISDKEAVWWGNYDEEGVARRFTEKTNLEVQRSNKSYYLNEYPFLIGHIDRKLVGIKAGLECKTTSAFNKTDYENGEIPSTHYAQCQHYMLVTGWDKWYIATKRDNREFHWALVNRDDEYIQILLEKELEFWDRVQNRVPPIIDGSESTSETVRTLNGITEDTEYDPPKTIDSNIEESIEIVNSIDEQIKVLEQSKKAYTNSIINWMGNSTYASSNDWAIDYKPIKGRTTFNSAQFKKDHPDIYQNYMKQGLPTRRLSFKRIGE